MWHSQTWHWQIVQEYLQEQKQEQNQSTRQKTTEWDGNKVGNERVERVWKERAIRLLAKRLSYLILPVKLGFIIWDKNKNIFNRFKQKQVGDVKTSKTSKNLEKVMLKVAHLKELKPHYALRP